MSVQTSYAAQSGALDGQAYDGHLDCHSLSVPYTDVAKVVTITVDAATNSHFYSVAADGILAHYTSDGSATTTEIKDGLVAAWNANAYCAAKATAASTGAATFTLTGVTAGDDFVVTLVGTTTSQSTTTAAQDNGVAPFGRGVVAGSTDGTCRPPVSSDAGTAFIGVVAHTHSHDPADKDVATDPDGVYRGKTASVVRRGRVHVPVVGTITKGTSGVYLYVTGTNRGKFRGDDDGANTVDVGGSFNVSWFTSSSGGRAVLELNL